MTIDIKAFAHKIYDMLKAKEELLGAKVFYGERAQFPSVPAITVEADSSILTPVTGETFMETVTVFVYVHSRKIAEPATLDELYVLVDKVYAELIPGDRTFGGTVSDGYPTRKDYISVPGVMPDMAKISVVGVLW